METVYEKYKSASEYLMEYYTWVDLLGIERREFEEHAEACLLYTSPSPRDRQKSRMPSSA